MWEGKTSWKDEGRKGDVDVRSEEGHSAAWDFCSDAKRSDLAEMGFGGER